MSKMTFKDKENTINIKKIQEGIGEIQNRIVRIITELLTLKKTTGTSSESRERSEKGLTISTRDQERGQSILTEADLTTRKTTAR